MGRRYNLFSVLLIFIFVTGAFEVKAQVDQTDSRGMKEGKWIGYYQDGTVRYEGFFKDNKPAGLMKRYYQGGVLKAELSFYMQGSRSRAVLYDTTGKLFAKGNYVEARKDSVWNYYKDGTLLFTDSYQNGKKCGSSRLFYPDGKIFIESEWKDGQLNGSYKKYSTTGKLIMATRYLNNQSEGLCVVYNESGQEEVEGNYKANARNGAWTYYTPTGKVRYVLNYKNGEIQNPQVLEGENKKLFDTLEKNKLKLKDPELYRNHPEDIMSDDGK